MIRQKKVLKDKKIKDFMYELFMEKWLSIEDNDQYSEDNEVDIFITARDKYRQLIRDIERAESSIHLLYFIIRDDRIGRTILDLLAKKARQGVQVRLLYDHACCLWTPQRIFQTLVESGAQVERFFPIKLGNYLRINFRNHRKLVIIDGLIGYLGGMNIGDEYMGMSPEHLPWRDTHLRLTGGSVYFLQMRFLADWLFATKCRAADQLTENKALFPPVKEQGKVKMRIVSSGPDKDADEIKWGFLRMIYAAKQRICIQTPYFVPDESFVEALRIAARSGVQIMIMVPSQTDNFIAHKVSLAYLGELLCYGVEVYFYPGFLHAKMILMDDRIVSLGSANMDMRSFSLNFEVNAFIYGAEFTKRCMDIFGQDLVLAIKMSAKEYAKRSFYEKLQERIFRLIAPLL